MPRCLVSSLLLLAGFTPGLLVVRESPTPPPAALEGSREPRRAPRQQVQQPIKFEPQDGVPTFAVRPPVLRLRPGAIVETRSFSRPGDYYEKAGGPWPGEVGPFFIEGATPEDTLVVRIVRLRPNRDTAVSAVNPTGISAVAGDSRTRMINDPLPARRFVWRLDRQRGVGILDLPNSASKSIEMPLKPMLGRMAVAPAGAEAFGGLWPGNNGGHTVFLPIFHEGAYFYFGDGHALQGDGEICGSGLETTMDVTFEFNLIKGRRIRWPRMEDADDIMVVGSARPLVDAFRIAQVELIEWLVDEYGFEKLEAYQVVSQGGHSRIANVVDPNYTVVAKFPKKLLPAKR
jgi:amidase